MNKTMLITGNRKGIGRYLTEFYLKKGLNLVGCSRSKSDLVHDNYLHVIGDVTLEKDVKKVINEAKNKFGSIDVLINNAGKASMNHSVLTPVSTVKNLFDTNYLGTFLFSRECSKLMMKKKYGRIINFSTVAVPLYLEGEMAYASSKSAIETMTKIFSKEISKYNITVNVIGPTPVMTDLIKVVPNDKVEEILNKQTLKRFGTFVSEKSSFITGQKIYLGGL